MTDESLRDEVEIKLIWLTHTLRDSEKKNLEDCAMELVLENKYIDIDRERIAFNKGIMWTTEYLYPRLNSRMDNKNEPKQ